MEKKTTNDPNNYLKLSQPFKSADAANEALTKFHKELGELRKKHKITDMVIATQASVRYKDGEVGQFMHHSAFGHQLNHEAMAAYMFGQLQAERRELINKLSNGKTK